MFLVSQHYDVMTLWRAVFPTEYLLWVLGYADTDRPAVQLTIERGRGMKLKSAEERAEAAALMGRLREVLQRDWKDVRRV